MSHHQFSIPVAVALTDEQAWSRKDKKGTEFFVARYHFSLAVWQEKEPIQLGAKLSTIESPEGVALTRTHSVVFERTEVNLEETLTNALASHEALVEFTSSLAASLGPAKVANIKSVMRAKSGEKFLSKLSENLSISRSLTNTVTETREVKHDIPHDVAKRFVFAEAYQRHRATLNLSYVDHLTVRYSSSLFGLRKKRKKLPRIIDAKKKQNIRKIDREIVDLRFWKPLRQSEALMEEGQYKQTVDDPEAIEVLPPTLGKARSRGFPSNRPVNPLCLSALVWR